MISLAYFSVGEPCYFWFKHGISVLKPAERLEGTTAGMNLHALAELCVRAGFILVPAVSEPALDLSHLPVKLLRQAIQMA